MAQYDESTIKIRYDHITKNISMSYEGRISPQALIIGMCKMIEQLTKGGYQKIPDKMGFQPTSVNDKINESTRR